MDIDMAVLRSLEREKEISLDVVVEAIEQALLVAYHRTEGAQQHARAELDRKTGHVTVYARELAEDGTVAREYDDTPADFGRIAATTAKQIILQRLRDAEDEVRYGEFSGKEGDIVSGVVQQGRDPRIGDGRPRQDRGRAAGAGAGAGGEVRARLPAAGVRRRRPQGLQGPADHAVSRTHPNLVKKLFALEVPEIADGTVEITAIAREAGHRTKIAVRTPSPAVNAKGACIGPMGSGCATSCTSCTARRSTSSTTRRSGRPSSGMRCPRRRLHRSRSSTLRRAPRGSSSPTTSSRWRSARRGRTPAWPPGSPGGGSTSGRDTDVTRDGTRR